MVDEIQLGWVIYSYLSGAEVKVGAVVVLVALDMDQFCFADSVGFPGKVADVVVVTDLAAAGSCCSGVALGMVVVMVRGCCSTAGGYRTTEAAAPSWAAFDPCSGSNDDSRCFLPSHCRQIPNFRHPHNVVPSVSTTIAYRIDRLAMQLLV